MTFTDFKRDFNRSAASGPLVDRRQYTRTSARCQDSRREVLARRIAPAKLMLLNITACRGTMLHFHERRSADAGGA
jgi:hypothetical protein